MGRGKNSQRKKRDLHGLIACASETIGVADGRMNVWWENSQKETQIVADRCKGEKQAIEKIDQ
jgi:hypothetical protein